MPEYIDQHLEDPFPTGPDHDADKVQKVTRLLFAGHAIEGMCFHGHDNNKRYSLWSIKLTDHRLAESQHATMKQLIHTASFGIELLSPHAEAVIRYKEFVKTYA